MADGLHWMQPLTMVILLVLMPTTDTARNNI